MADRNWDKELAKVDKQLASLSDDQLVAPAAPVAAPRETGRPSAKSQPVSTAPTTTKTSLIGVYGRLGLAMLVGFVIAALVSEGDVTVRETGFLESGH